MVARLAVNIVTCHDSSGEVRAAGGAVRALLGADPRELQGAGLFDRIHPSDRPAFLANLARALNGCGAPPIEIRLRGEGSEGSLAAWVWVEMQADNLAAPIGEVTCSFREIAERKALGRELEELRAASPDRAMSRLLARAAARVDLDLQRAERAMLLNREWTRHAEKEDILEPLAECRSGIVRLEAILQELGRNGGDGRLLPLSELVSRCRDELGPDGHREFDIGSDPACDWPMVLLPAGAGMAVLRILLHEIVALRRGTAPAKLSVNRSGSEVILRVTCPIAAGTEASVTDPIWLELGARLAEPFGGMIAAERRDGVHRLLMRLPASAHPYQIVHLEDGGHRGVQLAARLAG